jgi:pyrophosphatase PpaX
MKEFDYYLFDADGTLFDTTEMIVRCFTNTATVHSLPVPDRSSIIRHVGMTLRAQMEVYFGKLTDKQFAQYREVHMTYQLTIYKEYLKLCPGVGEALASLREKGKRCAVVTSRMMQTLSIYLRETGIIGFFEVLITPEATKCHKPQPEPAFEAMQQLEADPARTVFIGDSTFDMECGKSAGCATVFVTWSHTGAQELKDTPDFCISDMRELCSW